MDCLCRILTQMKYQTGNLHVLNSNMVKLQNLTLCLQSDIIILQVMNEVSYLNPMFEDLFREAFFRLRNQGSVREIQSFLDDNLKDKVVYQPCPMMIARYLYPELPRKTKTGEIAYNIALGRAKLKIADKTDDEILNQIAQTMYQISKKDMRFIL